MWTSLYYQPINMNRYQLEVKNKAEIYTIEGTVTEKQMTVLNTETHRCKPDSSENYDFNSCSKLFFARYFTEHFKCSLPGYFKHNDLTLKKTCFPVQACH